jgi:hypothetical protein
MAVNVVQAALSSRRFNRWLLVLGSLVLVAGIIAVVVTFTNNSKTENSAPTGPPIKAAPPAQPNIKMPAQAWNVASRFMFTALPRKHLATAYRLADASMLGGMSLSQWKTGSIQAPYFPTAKIVRYNWKNTNYRHPREIAQNVILIPGKSSGTFRPMPSLIILKKIGGQWKVDYFGPVNGPPVPTPK